MNTSKHIHFVGIKGVGMTPLALIARAAGFTVSGCDVDGHFITDAALLQAGILSGIGFHEEHIYDCDLVIATGAHGGMDHIEVKAAEKRGIPVWMQGEAVGEFMKGGLFERFFQGISVAGCHGKTTTTAMIATILRTSGKDPSYVVGTSMLEPLGLPGHYGNGNYFVAESDEYATDIIHDRTPKFLWQYPTYEIITNIELDHPDLYSNISQMIEAYREFTLHVEKKGLLIVNGDDKNIRTILESYRGKYTTFGFGSTNNYRIDDIRMQDGTTRFVVRDGNDTPFVFALAVLGRHNVLNAVAAFIVAREIGVELRMIYQGLASFRGTKRRLEYKGRLHSGALVYDDYAHHPTEIKASLSALKEGYSDKKIVCIFQPHTYSRTKLLFDQFINSFDLADDVVLHTIFPSAREPLDSSVSSALLSTAMGQRREGVSFLPEMKDVVQYIDQKRYGNDTIIVTMGAGDIYEVGEQLLLAYDH